jgi:hypothetical protein
MPNITTFEILSEQIEKAGGRPTVLEALWDGDTQGWFLVLDLYVETGKHFWKKEEIIHLGIVSFGGDIRLFTGEVPAWPEAELAKEWGNKACEKYGLTFYFPSDKEPDNNCPSWTQRHLAIKCADCGKLIIPTESPYLPKEICYSCHLKREQNEKIKNAIPYDDGVTMYLSKNDEYENIGYCTHYEDFTIAPYIIEQIQARLTEKAINIITLDKRDITELKEKLEKALANKLTEYKKPNIEERMKGFISLYTVEYKGNKYELMDRFNDEHSAISNLIYSLETAEKAISENFSYKIIFKKGITYRDDTVLRFVNYVCQGTSKISEISKQYASVMTEDDVLDTLKKLEQIDCLTILENEVSITRIGKCIV